MATNEQKGMVDDICAIIEALKMKGVSDRLTINELCEMNNRSSLQIRSMIMRMASAGELALLRRLHQAFLSVNLNPKYLAEAITEMTNGLKLEQDHSKPAAEALQLARSMPMSMAGSSAAAANLKPMVEHGNFGAKKDPVDDAMAMIRILEKHDLRSQRKMLSTVLAWQESGT